MHGRAWHPQTQGAVEAVNKNYKKILFVELKRGGTFFEAGQRAKDKYNKRIHGTTQYSPEYVFQKGLSYHPNVNIQDYSLEELEEAVNITRIVKKNIEKRALLDKKNSEKRLKKRTYIDVGCYVWHTEKIMHTKKKLNQQKKRELSYYGRVIERKKNNLIVVEWLLNNGGPKGENRGERSTVALAELRKSNLQIEPIDGTLTEDLLDEHEENSDDEDQDDKELDIEMEEVGPQTNTVCSNALFLDS